MLTATSIGTGGLGRFGNQMFTIAGVIGIALKNNQTFGFPEWKNYDNALFGDPVDNFNDYFENQLPDTRGQSFNEYGYFWGYRDIRLPEGNWSINAHLQSGKFFDYCIDTIRHYLRLKNEPDQNDYVAIHYRAGDYIDDPNAYHPRCTAEYYKEAMSHFKNDVFLIFSDDIEAAKKIFGTGFRVHYSVKRNYIQDFALMKRCKSFIIANSSYSAMAAHLGEHPEKRVVAPKKWFGPNVGAETVDIYNKEWLII